MSIVVIGFIVTIILYKHYFWQAQPWPDEALQVPPFQAHRGAHEQQTENTLEAFREAVQKGAKMIELDVRLSKDQQVVVYHDESLQRLQGLSEFVADLTAQELYTRAKAPTLKQVLHEVDAEVFFNIEIKSTKIKNTGLELAVSQVIKELGFEKRVMISSFNPVALWRLEKLLPEVPRALLVTHEVAPGNAFYLKHMWLAPYLKIHLLHLDHRYFPPSSLHRWLDRGIPVSVWTVNDHTQIAPYQKAGVLSIISDLDLSADS